MKIQLSDHFTYPRLLRFVFPSIVMMIFTSIYSVVDGLFVSNYVGKTAFAALNLVYPVLMAVGALGFMMGTGGSAIVSITLGLGDREKANRYFSMLIYVTVAVGLAVTALGMAFLRPIVLALGAEGEMIDLCVQYGSIILAAETAFMLQNTFQSFCVTAEKPELGLSIMAAAGVINMILDFLLVAVFPLGLTGAALATAISQTVGGLLPVLYFARPNNSLLRLTRTRLELEPLWRACVNGSSELMSNLSSSLVNVLYNFQLLRLAGEDGVAAYGVIMYVNFIFTASFFGYVIGSGPLIGYHFGAGNNLELKNLFRKSTCLIGVAGTSMTALGILLSPALAAVFVGYDAGLQSMTSHGLQLYSLSFLLAGTNIFGSAFFTALNNGLLSALISFLRTLLFQTTAVLLLPALLKLDGVWLAIVAAEGLTVCVTALLLLQQRRRYQYA